jgi:hypothetical protein
MTDYIVVCDACLTEACIYGEQMCEDAWKAGTVKIAVKK